jgi:hypothetical protein
LAYLNSSLGRYLCKRYVSILDNGGYLMQKAYLESIPILNPGQEKIDKIETLSQDILKKHKKSIFLELEINKIIFSFFAFTHEEIKYIENDNLEALLR